jgi:hypothetical protein
MPNYANIQRVAAQQAIPFPLSLNTSELNEKVLFIETGAKNAVREHPAKLSRKR